MNTLEVLGCRCIMYYVYCYMFLKTLIVILLCLCYNSLLFYADVHARQYKVTSQ
jgi:hypothetical protein